jgi:dipeptidyl aminopeptidase/acylaminoacyl peptidase
MFIFHGTADRNAPYEKTVQVVEKLRSAGARLEFWAEEGKGHSAPGPEILARYRQWLQTVIAPEGPILPSFSARRAGGEGQ